MEIIIKTFESVALLLGLGILGFWMLHRKILFHETMGFLSTLALDIALPCLVFVNVIVNFQPSESPGWWELPLWWVGFTLFAMALTGSTMRIAGKGNRREFGITLFYQNGLFFPLAILTAMYGSESIYIVHLFFFVTFFAVAVFATLVFLVVGILNTPVRPWRHRCSVVNLHLKDLESRLIRHHKRPMVVFHMLQDTL